MTPEISAIFPTSAAQERLWIIERLSPGTAAYHVPVALRLRGALDLDALGGALSLIVERHEALRTVFDQIDGQTVQRVLPAEPVHVEIRDVPGREAELAELLPAEAALGFAVDTGPLLRATLFRLGDQEHILMVVLHHLVSDGWSMGVLFGELSVAYDALTAGVRPELPELALQYVDYAIWEREQLTGDRAEELLGYWREALADAPPALELPTDRPRPVRQSHAGGEVEIGLSAELSQGVVALSRSHGVSPFMVLTAAWGALLGRFTGSDDVVVGTAVGGRDAQTEGLIGCFINTLPLRVRLDGDPAFSELLGRVKNVTLGALEHQELPFDRLVQDLAPRRELGRNPLVQVLLTVHNGPAPAASLHGLEVEPVPVERGGAQCDLSVQLRQTGDRFEGFLEFASDLFDASTLRRWWGHLTTLLSAAVAEPGTSLSELPCLTAAEIAQVAVEWNQNEAPFDDVLLHDIVSRQAAATPEAPALVWDGGSLSYAEYERRADALADVLRNWGVGPEVPVALYLERDADLMVAVLGVLKAGGAYLPLNLSYPQERIELMLDDARPAVLLTQRRLADRVPSGWPVVLVDDLPSAPAGTTEVSTSNLAYVIYTSGSTGRPKGVMAQHRSATELLAWQQRRYPIGSGDVVLLKTPVSFDVSVPELFWWALAGARLALLPEGAEKDPRALVETIRRHGVTMVNFVPSMFGPFLELLEADPELAADAASLRQIFCAGEALPIEQVRRFHRVFDGSATKLVNLYGPTETSVWNSSFDCAPETTRVLIGRPRDNTGFYLLDSHGRLQPVGVPGELCISGESITRGYLDRPGLTADRYVPHPFAGTHGVPPGARMYRTGDLARFTSDGSVEWIGRLDLQVKVRGFRVELGEITAALRAHPAVGSAVVVLREGRLAAYYTGGAELTVPELTVTELRGFLRRTLPDHMVPESFTPLGVLPVTTSGKVDTAALPEPDGSRPVLGTAYVAPGTPLEKVVAGIWAEVLRVDRAGAQDDFFDLGGNSLLATQVTSALRENLGVEIPLRVMFEAPTVAAQAELVGAAGREASLDLGTIAELYLQVQELSDDQVRELLAVQEG